MSEKQVVPPPTHEEIDQAMDLLVRAAAAGQSPTSVPTPRVDRKMNAWRKQQEKNRTLIAECEEASNALYAILMEFLPDQYKDILGSYSLLAAAPRYVNEHSYNLFKMALRDAKKKHLKKPATKRARGKSS